ncbi:hypothetical protein RRG08_019399 [Elysia crispata]|uniref:Uncharacterized protein n=1 Tax=Elysia crispata TaxID=231223 RepID=A0AAE0ZTF6_9GAST|nr:hypothetical protein RRG08_019399 [Elysia crispata]
MKKDITEIVKECKICERCNKKSQQKQPILQQEVPTRGLWLRQNRVHLKNSSRPRQLQTLPTVVNTVLETIPLLRGDSGVNLRDKYPGPREVGNNTAALTRPSGGKHKQAYSLAPPAKKPLPCQLIVVT